MNIKYERMNEYWIWKDEWILNMKGWINIEYERMNECWIWKDEWILNMKKMNIEYVRKYEWINEYWILNINE